MENDLTVRRRGLSGGTLKTIALISMLIDHAAVILLMAWEQQRGAWGSGLGSEAFYIVLHVIGRLAFPIYCFLLVEGFIHTRSRVKYLLRLLAFALLSEVPFDLAFYQSYFYMDRQNVFFTLTLGLLAMMAWEALVGDEDDARWTLRKLLVVPAVGACCLLGLIFHVDYGAKGVALIVTLYLLRRQETVRDVFSVAILCVKDLFEIAAIPAFALLHFYDGSRGRYPKYLFYVFYPAHLLLLALLRRLIFSA